MWAAGKCQWPVGMWLGSGYPLLRSTIAQLYTWVSLRLALGSGLRFYIVEVLNSFLYFKQSTSMFCISALSPFPRVNLFNTELILIVDI